MTPERWRQVKDLFDQAVECDPAARAAFIGERCGSDEELRKEVERLVAADRETGLLDRPVIGSGSIAAAVPARGVDPMVGRVIGNYVIAGELAQGGMGIVYRARHVTLPRDAVVKCIRPLAVSEQARNELRTRFKREAHIQSQLDHPHIVRVYEFFAGADEYFLVMEYVPGSSLRSMLDRQRILTVQEASRLAAQALEGLQHAHDLHFVDESGNTGVGIIHRDIKPGNLLVDDRGNLKLTDFGIAKVLGESQLTRTGFGPGTAEYMSPEQVRNLPVDPRSDLYSLGVTLYEMLSGRVPFPRTRADSDYSILKAHVEIDPPLLEVLNPEIPRALAEVVARSLKKDPDQRWQTAAEFREALISWERNPALQTAPAVGPPPALPGPRRIGRRRLTMTIGAAVLALILILAAGVFWLGHSGKNAQPSIAVLPFVNLNADKDQEYFSEGLAEELLNALANTPGLRVVGRTSSFQFKGNNTDVSEIGKKLRVAVILEGSVRKQGNQARIDVRLIQAADGFQMWSHTYTTQLSDMSDIFGVQEDIARAVTGALKVTLLGKKTLAPSARSTNAAAYNAYLQGRYYFFVRQNKENLEKSAGYFAQAIELDPGYALAWVGLGESRTSQAGSAYIPLEEGYRKAREAVERALTLDPGLAEAHAALGEIQMIHDWDWTGADASYRRALALKPEAAGVLRNAGSLARYLGQLDAAIKLYRRAIEMDPLLGHKTLGLNLYYAGRQDEAKAALEKALEFNPETTYAHGLLSQVYLAQPDAAKALAEAGKESLPAYRLSGLALALHALGRNQESEANLAELIAKYRTDGPYLIAEVYAFRGETDRAFEWLEQAYAGRDPGLTEMKADPLLASIRRDPRFTALLKKMRLPL